MTLHRINRFVRQKEEAFARKLLVWKYEQAGSPVPDEKTLSGLAEKVVADAHRIAADSGHNVLEILKSGIRDVKK